MKITVRQMQVFDAVAATGSVTAAANRLNMSQSAASSALTDLQIILHRPLFAHAKGRALQITEEGRRLQPVIRSLLAELHDIEHDDATAPLRGKLVVGATATIAETVLPRLCVDFMARHPQVRIHVEAEAVGDLFARLGRFEIETALAETSPDVDGVELIPWRTDEMLLVVSADHVLAGRGRMTIADLKDMAWCTREAASPVTARLRAMLYDVIGPLPVAFESTSNWAVRHAVIAGGGIGCLSRLLVQFDLDNGRLVQLDVADFAYSQTLSLARPQGIWRSRLISAFDRFLLDHRDSD